jgi:hypothetical protein
LSTAATGLAESVCPSAREAVKISTNRLVHKRGFMLRTPWVVIVTGTLARAGDPVADATKGHHCIYTMPGDSMLLEVLALVLARQ